MIGELSKRASRSARCGTAARQSHGGGKKIPSRDAAAKITTPGSRIRATHNKGPDLETAHDPRNSPNGDKWLLAREPDSGRVFVRHIPNMPSGGRTTDIEIGAFLCERSYGPQHIELLRLIGTLIEKRPDLTES